MLKLARVLTLAAVVASFAPLAIWLWAFSSHRISAAPEDWSSFGQYIGGVVSPLLAFFAFVGLLLTLRQQQKDSERRNQQENDLRYFEHARSSLQRAYDAISLGGHEQTPTHDRLAWLACARYLLSANNVARLISAESQGLGALYAGEAEHWRQRFYELFNPPGRVSIGVDRAYFMEAGSGGEIDERSIRAIFDFFTWRDEESDPIDAIPRYSDEDLASLGALMSGVREHLQHRRGRARHR
jgi:hypothetical protein